MNESDWKTFRKLVPECRERYLEGRNAELVAMLKDEVPTPTERFWNVEERSKEIAKILRRCLDGHSRSRMLLSMMMMRREGMLSDEDLERFSDEVRERLKRD